MSNFSSERLPRLGRYQVLSKIAEGGMAEIFLAKAIGAMGFERLVAIKLIRPHLTEDPDFVKMFLDEARIAMHLHHRNIVQTSDLERAKDTYFIAMEFVHGVNLYDLYEGIAERGAWVDLPLSLYIISEACKGLQFAHTRTYPDGRPLSIIHRDISPQNILLSFEGEVKIMDFGIAKASERLHHTMPGIVKGKYAYMAPEILHDKPVDHRVDVFAAGVVLYELLTRENPFAGANAVETIEAVLSKPVIPPSEKVGMGSRSLDAIVMKALAKNPEERFQTARELSAALTDYGLGLTGARWDIAAGDSSVANLLQKVFPEKAAQTFTQSAAEDVVLPRAQGQSHSAAPEEIGAPTQERIVTDAENYAAQETLLRVSAVEGNDSTEYDDEAQTALALDVHSAMHEAVEATTSTTLPPDESATDRALDAIIDESEAGVTRLDQGFLAQQLAMDSIAPHSNEVVEPAVIRDRGPTQAPRRQRADQPGFVIPEPAQKHSPVDDTTKELRQPQSHPQIFSNGAQSSALNRQTHSPQLRTASYPSADVHIPQPVGHSTVTPGEALEAQRRGKTSTYLAYSAVVVMFLCLLAAIMTLRAEPPAIVEVPVTSEPAGATVIINGDIQATKTPLSAKVSSGYRYRIEISAPGYRTFSKDIEPKANSQLQINAVLFPK